MLRLRKQARTGGKPPRRPVDPNQPPFSSFLERDQERQKRDVGRRRTFVLSLGLHIVALVALLVYSFMHVDELFGPSVEVKIFNQNKLPDAVNRIPVRTVRPPPR